MPRNQCNIGEQEISSSNIYGEIDGMLNDKPISIMIDLGISLIYVSPIIIELYKLQQDNFEKSWLVQLTTCIK